MYVCINMTQNLYTVILFLRVVANLHCCARPGHLQQPDQSEEVDTLKTLHLRAHGLQHELRMTWPYQEVNEQDAHDDNENDPEDVGHHRKWNTLKASTPFIV